MLGKEESLSPFAMKMKESISVGLRKQFGKKFQWTKTTHSIQIWPDLGKERRHQKSSKTVVVEAAGGDKIVVVRIVVNAVDEIDVKSES